MKLLNFSSLSYCALILLFGSVSASAEAEPELPTLSVVEWEAPKGPSRILKWTTDPKHAWWDKVLVRRQNEPSQATPVVLPTQCQYIDRNSETGCAEGCVCDTQCTSIFIWNQSRPEPKPQYHICTNWNLNHGYQLRAGFQEVGFEMVPNRTRCGWQRLDGVSAMRVGRGSINVNGTLDQPFGDPYELGLIHEVMRREYPFVEIIIICATLVGPIFMFAGMFGWCFWASRDKPVKYSRLPKA